MITCFALLVNRIYRFFKVNGIFLQKRRGLPTLKEAVVGRGTSRSEKAAISVVYQKNPPAPFLRCNRRIRLYFDIFCRSSKADAAARRIFSRQRDKTKRIDNTTSIVAEILKPCASLKLHTRCFFNLSSRFNCSQ